MCVYVCVCVCLCMRMCPYVCCLYGVVQIAESVTSRFPASYEETRTDYQAMRTLLQPPTAAAAESQQGTAKGKGKGKGGKKGKETPQLDAEQRKKLTRVMLALKVGVWRALVIWADTHIYTRVRLALQVGVGVLIS